MNIHFDTHTIFFILFLNLLFHPFSLSSDSKEIYYKSYSYDLKSPNVTLGAIAPITINDRSILSAGFLFAAICQANLINQGVGPVNISGKINIVAQKISELKQSGQQASMSLFENNLFNSSTNLPVYGNQAIPLLGIFGFTPTETSQINAFISNGFGVPFVSAGARSDVDLDNKLLLNFGSTNTTFYQVRDTLVYDSFQAALDTLNYFNWTIVGSIFQDNSYGYRRQADVQLHQSLSAAPDFACNEIFSVFQILGEGGKKYLTNFCQCITEKSEINVIVLWMAVSEAGITITALKSQCPAAEKWTFLITYDNDFQFNSDLVSDIFKDSLLLRQFNNWNFKKFVSNCVETASPDSQIVLKQLEAEIYSEMYDCVLSDSNASNGTVCKSPFYNRAQNNGSCVCNMDELSLDIYSSKYFFTADSITLYALAISLLQNNCTYLNEILTERKKNYCDITTFDPSDISVVMRYVNFTGYSEKKYYLYNIQTTIIDAVQVGTLSISGVSINESAVQFVDGVVPVSTIVPQNPDLSYAVVDVFFALAIFLMVICLIVFVLFVYNRNNSIIRRNTPIVSILMLVGVALGILTIIINSMAVNDALCAIELYTYTGFYALLLSGLIVKNFRIYKIFSNASSESITISELSLILVMLAILSIYWIVITIAVSLGFGAETLQSSSNPYYFYVVCAFSSSKWSVIFKCFIQISFVVLLIVLLIFSWLTRRITSRYSESREMAAFFVISAALFIVLTPLYLTLGSETDSELFKYIILAELLLISALGALLLLFIPKLYQIYRK